MRKQKLELKIEVKYTGNDKYILEEQDGLLGLFREILKQNVNNNNISIAIIESKSIGTTENSVKEVFEKKLDKME